MEMKAGLTFACMNLKKLAKILAMGNRKSMSFMLKKVEILLDEIKCNRKVAPDLTIKHHFVYSLKPRKRLFADNVLAMVRLQKICQPDLTYYDFIFF